MTESDIGSDKHKRPSSADIDNAEKYAVLRERVAQAKARDIEIMTALKEIKEEQARQGIMLALGNQRFDSIESTQVDTTARLTAVEADKRGPVAIVIGTLAALASGATAWLK